MDQISHTQKTGQSLDAHFPHERPDMRNPHLEAFPLQQALKHPAACEGIVKMKGVNPAHEREVGRRRCSRQVIDTATAYSQ
jgi:hypothetical protein